MNKKTAEDKKSSLGTAASRPYNVPRVMDYGDLGDLTKGGGGTKGDGAMGAPPNTKA